MVECLRTHEALLIVDNCEHLAATVARSLATLIRSCPRPVLLATSQPFEWKHREGSALLSSFAYRG